MADTKQQAIVTKALTRLYTENINSGSRVQMMLEAIAVAEEFTRERRAQQLHDALNSLAGVNEIAPNIEVLRNHVPIMSEQAASTLPPTMRAASVILTHSQFDEVLNRLLLIWMVFQPIDWRDEIHSSCKTTYTLKQLDTIKPEQMMVDAAKQYFNRQKHDSISKRNDAMLRHLGKLNAINGLKFLDTQTLKDFDQKRHKLVHGNSMLKGDGELGEVADEECRRIFAHATGLMQGLAQAAGVNWETITELIFLDEEQQP